MNIRKNFAAYSVITATLALVLGSSTVANAQVAAEANINSPVELLTDAAPGTLPSDTPGVSTHSKVQNNGVPKVETSVEMDDESRITTVSLQLDDTTEIMDFAPGIKVASGAESNVARYTVESPSGLQVMTAYQKPQENYSSRTTFNFKAGEKPVPGAFDSFYIEDSDGTVNWTITKPWAKDANGKDISTSYRWEGSTLIQDVYPSSDSVFPIIADPAWHYTWTAKIYTGSVKDVHGRMHTCFNCYFPVEGAPKKFPTAGQFLPLVVGLAPGFLSQNFNCTFGSERYVAGNAGTTDNPIYGDFAFYFDSAKGHVDGLGSSISFDFYGDKRAPNDPMESVLKMKLVIHGNIANSNPVGMPQAVYKAGAKNNWSKLLVNYTAASAGAGGFEGQHWRWAN